MDFDPRSKHAKTTGKAATLTRDVLALRALEVMAHDSGHMQVFLDETGLETAALGAMMSDASMQVGVLDHVLSHEAVLIALAGALKLPPDDTVAAIWRVRHSTDG